MPAGSAFLQRITLKEQEEDEEYRVVVFRNQPGGVARGLGQPVRLTELRTAVLDSEYTVGVGDLTGLIDGWELPGGTDPSSAVVLVDPTRSEPPPPMMVMSIHDEKGDPYGDGQACVAFYTDEGTEQSVVPPGCTMTIEVPGWGGPVSGFVLMQSPPVGQYRVEVFIDDESQLTITEFEVVRRPPIIGGYATGPSDTSGLLEGESIDSPPYDERIAIVVPRGGS